MRHFDNFVKTLEILLKAEKEKAFADEFYRMGVIWQFNLTFEQAWKATKDILQFHGVSNFKMGSPREILKTAYQLNFLHDEEVWLDILKDRNSIVHIYDENAAVELTEKIFGRYISAFVNLRKLLTEKISALQSTKL